MAYDKNPCQILALIVPDQKVVVDAFFNAVVYGGECTSMSVGPNGGV